eukprot:CAMPEP_0178389104 /NCGR_PEP_ID=MMETSP0689_2-20121128/9938_1 /TAXON_ID=160604 /ORGANISM="Amphidinium massartii, Strain CS-259" /LENGTH=270 /DNA_ID=CAMNT_0020009531 /DNA_START=35 /DNA_END=847 /DNA_ORIENTATION=+
MAPFARDCGICTVELVHAESNNSACPWIVVTTRARHHADSEIEEVFGALDEAFHSPGSMAAVYDLRQHRVPSLRMVREVAKIAAERRVSWQTSVIATAVVLQQNSWAAVMKGLISVFVKICQPSCPLQVFFSMAEAEEFLRCQTPGGMDPSGDSQLSREYSVDSCLSFRSVESACQRGNEVWPISRVARHWTLWRVVNPDEAGMSRAESFASVASWNSCCTKKEVVELCQRPGMANILLFVELMQKHGNLVLRALADMLLPTTKFCSVCK